MIRKYSFAQKAASPLWPGELPCYMAKHKKLFFYGNGGKDGDVTDDNYSFRLTTIRSSVRPC